MDDEHKMLKRHKGDMENINIDVLGHSTVGNSLISMSISPVCKIRKNATFINRVVI